MNSAQLIKPRLKVTALCFGKTAVNTEQTRLFLTTQCQTSVEICVIKTRVFDWGKTTVKAETKADQSELIAYLELTSRSALLLSMQIKQ
jgi:hypothetical protein